MNSEVRTEQSYMKKVLFGIGVLLLSPVLLFLLLTVLLYVPSVQNWMEASRSVQQRWTWSKEIMASSLLEALYLAWQGIRRLPPRFR